MLIISTYPIGRVLKQRYLAFFSAFLERMDILYNTVVDIQRIETPAFINGREVERWSISSSQGLGETSRGTSRPRPSGSSGATVPCHKSQKRRPRAGERQQKTCPGRVTSCLGNLVWHTAADGSPSGLYYVDWPPLPWPLGCRVGLLLTHRSDIHRERENTINLASPSGLS